MFARTVFSAALLLFCGSLAPAIPATGPAGVPERLRAVLHWRAIGPFRGGRTVAASGVPGRPHEFYIGAVNGGVFKTTDGGRTWTPIFDDQPSASIGAIAVAPSAPDTVYVGSGESRQRPDLSVGDGVYKSTDGGAHWTHLGLRDGEQIGKIVVDPHDANRLYVAVLGHPYGPNDERGIYRSSDGGATFERVLHTDANAGGFDIALDPVDQRTVYASLWAARQSPWETLGGASFELPQSGSGLYKSTDGGATWTRLEGGLPTAAQGIGRVEVAVAPSDAKRVYAFADATQKGGVYRSDDAGATWHAVNGSARVIERGDDLVTLGVDPRDRDTVYVTNTSTYKSTDGGATFTAFRGAPGGDDYQSIWIAPDDPRTILLASDQGAILTVNGGATWTSWYNQPTAQFYHVITDDRFPYRVYGGQQESGSAEVLSRGNDGAITFRDWHPVGVEEYGYVAPDPLHPGIVFGGKVTRFDERTGQTREVGPVVSWRGDPRYRFKRTAPLAFSPVDKRTLYLGSNVLFASADYGAHWRVVSPDLARPDPATPPNLGAFAASAPAKAPHRGVIYALGLSPRDRNIIWAGTDDGLVWRTSDSGKHWTNVTPPGLTAWAKISIIDASPFDAASAYVAVNRIRLDEQRPQLFRTHDGGRTWTEIDRGIDATPTNVVRADPQRRGLLYAGTERGVWVSFDDGASWSSLRLNLPATSVRDLVVHGDDVVIGTHGRGFWILDDVTPLRQAELLASSRPTLFVPAPAWRVRNDMNTDTPLPPDEPFAANPPAGAVIDYVLPHDAKRVSIAIVWAGKVFTFGSNAPPKRTVATPFGFVSGNPGLVRTIASDDPPRATDVNALDVPASWIAPQPFPATAAGVHRFVWDLRGPVPRARSYEPTIAAIPHDTPLEPEGPMVPPGRYVVTVDADGMRSSQTLIVIKDPRSSVPPVELWRQYVVAGDLVIGANRTYDAADRLRARDPKSAGELDRANAGLVRLLMTIESGDGTPTALQDREVTARLAAARALVRSARRP